MCVVCVYVAVTYVPPSSLSFMRFWQQLFFGQTLPGMSRVFSLHRGVLDNGALMESEYLPVVLIVNCLYMCGIAGYVTLPISGTTDPFSFRDKSVRS